MRTLFLLVLLSTAAVGRAQQPAPTATAPASRPSAAARSAKVPAVYHAAAPEVRAERLSQQISQQLGLDAATTARVKYAALARAQQIDAIQTGADSNKAKNTALQTNAQAFRAALKGILTPEQSAKYAAHGAPQHAE